MSPTTRALVRAAGAVVWTRSGEGAGEVLLVHRPRYDDWSLPKGKLDPGESWEAAAVREVAEETGVVGTLGAELAGTAYTVAAGPKLVRYWEMQAGRSATAGFAPNDEVDELRWVPCAAAAAVVDQRSDAVVLMALRARLQRRVGGRP